MAIKLIDISLSNTSLALLRARTYQSNYTALPNTKLSEDLRADLSVIYQAVASKELPVDGNTLLIKAENGYLSRLFAPVVGKNEAGQLCTRWGNTLINLDLESSDYSLRAGQFDFSGRGMDTCVFVSVRVGKDVVRMPMSIRLANWEQRLSTDELDYLLSDDHEQLFNTLGVLKEGGSTGSGSNSEMISLRDLEVEQKVKVIGYKEVQTSYGKNFVIYLDDSRQCWGHKSVNAVLAAKPVIDQDNPAELVLIEKREFQPGKWAVKAILLISAVDSEDLAF